MADFEHIVGLNSVGTSLLDDARQIGDIFSLYEFLIVECLRLGFPCRAYVFILVNVGDATRKMANAS